MILVNFFLKREKEHEIGNLGIMDLGGIGERIK